MTKAEFIESVAEVLEVPADSLEPATELKSVKGWDSTAVVNLIVLLDEMGIEVDEEKASGLPNRPGPPRAGQRSGRLAGQSVRPGGQWRFSDSREPGLRSPNHCPGGDAPVECGGEAAQIGDAGVGRMCVSPAVVRIPRDACGCRSVSRCSARAIPPECGSTSSRVSFGSPCAETVQRTFDERDGRGCSPTAWSRRSSRSRR